jgi:RES domain-containing protein
MPRAWRITKARHAGNAFDGEGARLQGGRWSSIGTRIVYTAGSESLAILEILVHLQETAFLSSYVVFELDFSDKLVQELDPASLPSNWRVSPAPPTTLAIGDDWIRNSSSVVLRVPSVIVPSEHNFLINPGHRDFSSISIGSPHPLDVDHRLLRK